jgi:hypothetical protein
MTAYQSMRLSSSGTASIPSSLLFLIRSRSCSSFLCAFLDIYTLQIYIMIAKQSGKSPIDITVNFMSSQLNISQNHTPTLSQRLFTRPASIDKTSSNCFCSSNSIVFCSYRYVNSLSSLWLSLYILRESPSKPKSILSLIFL